MTHWLVMVAVAISLVALSACVRTWGKVRELHRRQHLTVRQIASLGEQVVHLSRAASRAEARARAGDRAHAAVPHAQHGEEFFLWERCDFKLGGVFIEIGAYNGVSLSNSLFFEQLGWTGMLVEAHPDLAARCREDRPESIVAQVALGECDSGTTVFSMVRGAVGLDTLSFAATNDGHRRRVASKGGTIESVVVPTRTLAGLVAEHRLSEVDWVSIDVEGGELAVLKGAGLESFRPKLLLIEDNSVGADLAVRDYLRQFGYERELTVGCNDLYVRCD